MGPESQVPAIISSRYQSLSSDSSEPWLPEAIPPGSLSSSSATRTMNGEHCLLQGAGFHVSGLGVSGLGEWSSGEELNLLDLGIFRLRV